MSVLLFFLTIHFVFAFLYSNPFNSEKRKIDFYAQTYIYPYFHQNWNLFVPPPTSNYKLFGLYNNGKKVLDIFSEIKTKHQTNRLKGYETLIVAFSNSMYFFEKKTYYTKTLNGPIKNDLNFKILEQISKNYLEYTRKIKIEDLKLILVINEVSSNKQLIYYN